MNSFYGGVVRQPAVNVRRQISAIRTEDSIDAAPASTFHGSQSGATSPGPTNPAGCHLSYATAEMLDGRDFDTEGYFYE